MRRAELQRSLERLGKQHFSNSPDVRTLSPGVEIDLAKPCIVLGGRNGAGKSRLLRSIAELGGIRSVVIDVHHLVEQALMALRSRSDLDGMLEEYSPLDLNEEIVSAVKLIVGRDYSEVNWYSFEIEPSDPLVAERFKWGREQCLVPYFQVVEKTLNYDTLGMGLGEFSIHFLFWIFTQYRECESITLLLDEPDAYLPPVGASALIYHLANLCLRNKWKMMLSTHSEEIIRVARENQCFTMLRLDDSGSTKATHNSDDPSAGDTLLAASGVRRLLLCEDESAANLAHAICQSRWLGGLRQTSIVWGDGDGYLRTLQKSMPRPPKPEIELRYVFDGDQRSRVDASVDGKWPVTFLPTDSDPDTLFKGLAHHCDELAASLGLPAGQLAELLDNMTAEDPHDWVNALSSHFGRAHTLRTLASLWCQLHPDDVDNFIADIESAV